MSERPLHVLIIEDSDSDMELVVLALQKMGRPLEFHRVEDEATMREALTARTQDFIVSDWRLPRFGGPGALAIAKEMDPDVPFIIVSGTIGEELAVEAMRAGAQDYVNKDRLARLVPAVERELRLCGSKRQRRRTEEALRISEARFRCLFESGIVGIAIADVRGNIQDANQALLDLMGYSRAEMLSGAVHWVDMIPSEWGPSHTEAIDRLQPVAPLDERELPHKGGPSRPVLIGSALLDYPLCISFVADLTERKRAQIALAASEDKLRQAKKMEAVGRLAAGVAHDFNNILSVIQPYGELLRADLAEASPLRGYAEGICYAAERAACLTKQLLTFSRQQAMDFRVLDLSVVISNMDTMLRRLVGENVRLVMTPGPSLGCVKADQGSIEQVLMNLAINARDAMPGGGTITIETTDVMPDAEFEPKQLGLKARPHVRISVTDTGVGMDLATQGQIFEPFFTTKEKDTGTGLGLSIVLGIVQRNGGGIRVSSEPGKGSRFEVYLPRVKEVAPPAQPVTEHSVIPGTETILIAEDDDAVRAAAGYVLRRSGYWVLEARNGGEALLICEKHPDRIHLLLTDVAMPLMSGPDLARRLSTLRTDMRVLCMSGYIDDAIFQHGVVASNFAYLQKPITQESLTRKVRDVLDAPIGR